MIEKPIIKTLRGKTPEIHPEAWVAENATLIGDLSIQEKSTIWYNVVIRADVCKIQIGKETNIQDGTVIHGTYEKCGVKIGDRVTVGHLAMLHGCEIGDECLIGMGSIIMDQAVIGERCVVGAGSLVTEKSVFPPETLILGRPAKAVRKLTPDELGALTKSADNYLLYRSWYE